MFLEDEDVETLRELDSARRQDDYIVITDDPPEREHEIIHAKSPRKDVTVADTTAVTELVRLYEETRGILAKKDETIQDLSYRLGRAEVELRNTIPLVDYNKATFLLESAKTKNTEDITSYSTRIDSLEKELNKRNGVIVSLALLFVLVLAFSVVFFFFSPRI